VKIIGDVELCCANCWYSHSAVYKKIQLECHISPPEIKEAEQHDGLVTYYSVWPAVDNNMWCGEWTHIDTAKDNLPKKVRHQITPTKDIIEMQLEIGNRVEIQFGNNSYIGIICNIDKHGISLTRHEIIFDPEQVVITKLVPEKKG